MLVGRTSKDHDHNTGAYLLPHYGEPLFLGVRIDIRSNHEGNNVEKWYPSVLRQKFLSKRQG